MPTAERIASVNGVEIAYDAFGDDSDPALLLIMGLATQLIHWDEELCRLLAERGFHVVRFDNRDAGHSTKIEDGSQPNLVAAFAGDTRSASYTLEDMAADSVALLDVLGIDAAHLVGASMGGMIAQTIAIVEPRRALSLCSIMSTTGDRAVGQPTSRGLSALLAPAPTDREAYGEYSVRAFRAIGSPGYPSQEDRVRRLALAAYDRSHHPAGVARQLVAIAASGDRTARLGEVQVPTVVIHGREDQLIQRSGGEATARAIPNADLHVVPGMGHDLPPQLWPQLVDWIVSNAQRAG